MGFQLTASDEPLPESDQIRERMVAFNARESGGLDWKLLQVFLKEENGTLRGGLLGWTVWSWMHIDSLWVDEDLRGSGLGSRIMEKAETIAASRGCEVVEVDTFNFQARGFYERNGYKLFGTMKGIAKGNFERYYLRKELKPAQVPS